MFENPEAQLSAICNIRTTVERPNIRTLLQRVVDTQAALKNAPDSMWNECNEDDIAACEALCAGLTAATGLTRDELRILGEFI